MSDEKLRQELERLRTEAANLDSQDEAGHERLNGVIEQLERRLSEDEENDDEGLYEQVQESIAHFETQHPRATAILNEIMVTLSNMGI